MDNWTYQSCGKTPQEAFEGIWDLLRQSDNYCLREENGEWHIRLNIVPPTDEERKQFESLTGKE